MNLQLENTEQRWIIILVRFKKVMYNKKICFFTESVKLINENNLCKNNERYIVLGTVSCDMKLMDKHQSFSSEELVLTKKFLYNQSNSNKKDCHFNTSGTIHSFGYGPMYHQNPITKHTIDKFTTRKSELFIFLMLIFLFKNFIFIFLAFAIMNRNKT